MRKIMKDIEIAVNIIDVVVTLKLVASVVNAIETAKKNEGKG